MSSSELTGIRVDLLNPPKYGDIQQIFADIYEQHRASPRYFFVSDQYHEALKEHLALCHACSGRLSVPVHIREHVWPILNATTGHIVHLVALPGLPTTSVIAGMLSHDADDKGLTSTRVDLKKPATLDDVQQLFDDLYTQRRLHPDYLFMAEEDRGKLSHEIAGYTDVDPADCTVSRIINYRSGAYVHVVTLPDLEPGSVILGFFK